METPAWQHVWGSGLGKKMEIAPGLFKSA